jgi:septum formation protein
MMASAEIILASQSEARYRLLVSAGIRLRKSAPKVDETALRTHFLESGGKDMTDLAVALAAAKAQIVSEANRSALVIGADQLLLLDGNLLNKPSSLAEARSQLLQLRGKTHTLISAVAAARAGQPIWSATDRAKLTMRQFSNEFISEYLAYRGQDVLTTVGAYKIEESDVQLFDEIRGDYFTILGLPLLPLLAFLRNERCLLS